MLSIPLVTVRQCDSTFLKLIYMYARIIFLKKQLSHCHTVTQEGSKKDIERPPTTAYPPLIHPMGGIKAGLLGPSRIKQKLPNFRWQFFYSLYIRYPIADSPTSSPRGGGWEGAYFSFLNVSRILHALLSIACKSSMLTRSCAMVSRWRIVTQLSFNVS